VSAAKSKSLKDHNRWQLWLTIAANFIVFYTVSQTDSLVTLGIRGFVTGAANLLPVGLALVVTSIANGLLDANMKARLVFLRWHHALPGHRAFSKYGPVDPRIDMGRLNKVLGAKKPATPDEENRAWYRIYKEMETDPAIAQVHREFLFTRDYTALSFLFLVGFGTASFFFVSRWSVTFAYCGCLLLQLVIVRQAAATYGARFVTTVLARKAAKGGKS